MAKYLRETATLRVFPEQLAAAIKMAESVKSVPREGHPKTREPGSHRALRWDSVPFEGYLETLKPRNYTALRGEGHPETSEPRIHTVLRGSLFSRTVADPREGISSPAQELRSSGASALFYFFASSLSLLISSWLFATRESYEAADLIKDIYWRKMLWGEEKRARG